MTYHCYAHLKLGVLELLFLLFHWKELAEGVLVSYKKAAWAPIFKDFMHLQLVEDPDLTGRSQYFNKLGYFSLLGTLLVVQNTEKCSWLEKHGLTVCSI